MLPALLHLTDLHYRVLAGLTVYAVPQVPATTAPIGTVAVHIATLVKLVRFLVLGPVVLGFLLLTRRMRDETDEAAPHVTVSDRPEPSKLPLHKPAPWFSSYDSWFWQVSAPPTWCRMPPSSCWPTPGIC